MCGHSTRNLQPYPSHCAGPSTIHTATAAPDSRGHGRFQNCFKRIRGWQSDSRRHPLSPMELPSSSECSSRSRHKDCKHTYEHSAFDPLSVLQTSWRICSAAYYHHSPSGPCRFARIGPTKWVGRGGPGGERRGGTVAPDVSAEIL